MVNQSPRVAVVTPLLRRLRLPQLELVRMVGSGANFRQISDALHVTQPAITKMAQELDRALGAPVFERGANGVRLSAFGSAVLTHAQRALAALDQLAEELPSYRQGATPAGYIRAASRPVNRMKATTTRPTSAPMTRLSANASWCSSS